MFETIWMRSGRLKNSSSLNIISLMNFAVSRKQSIFVSNAVVRGCVDRSELRIPSNKIKTVAMFIVFGRTSLTRTFHAADPLT